MENAATIPAFQQRVIDEERELRAKAVALANFLPTATFIGLPLAEQGRLSRQLRHMEAYAVVLCERIQAFGIPSGV